jgi:hypothetical protein
MMKHIHSVCTNTNPRGKMPTFPLLSHQPAISGWEVREADIAWATQSSLPLACNPLQNRWQKHNISEVARCLYACTTRDRFYTWHGLNSWWLWMTQQSWAGGSINQLAGPVLAATIPPPIVDCDRRGGTDWLRQHYHPPHPLHGWSKPNHRFE